MLIFFKKYKTFFSYISLLLVGATLSILIDVYIKVEKVKNTMPKAISTVDFQKDLNNYVYKLNNIKSSKVKHDDVTIVTYAGGDPIYYLNQTLLAQSAHDFGIDRVFPYNPSDIDKNFYERNKEILTSKRGAGYWLWKPYIILDAMKRVPKDSIIIYIDGGLYFTKDFAPFIDLVKKHGRVLTSLAPVHHTNKRYTKRDTFILMDKDYERAHQATQVQAGIILLKNNDTNRKFIEKWLEYGQDKRIITDLPSTLGSNFPDFIDHRHDQSILSLLLLDTTDEAQQKIIGAQDISEYIKLHGNKELHNILGIAQSYLRKFAEN
jgi:hypothetical protein